jgi:mono/diheme cytochrome c family protein
MKKFLKWAAIAAGLLVVVAFLGFLYLIPPFTLAPPETFSKPETDAAPSLDQIADPAQRALAERGKYIVQIIGCAGCHTPGGDKGPQWDKYLAGGFQFTKKGYGTVVSRNLTPDMETGLASRNDEQVKRVLRSGVFSDGRVVHPLMMPWADFSNMTEEDRHAVVVFLRNLKPVRHKIPDWSPVSDADHHTIYGGTDHAIQDVQK